MMIPGNCLVCAIVVWIVYGGRIVIASREPGDRHGTSHFLVRDRQGRWRNFRRVRDVLPYPLCLLLFLGRFEVRHVKT
mgnify:CR=1 FL=1